MSDASRFDIDGLVVNVKDANAVSVLPNQNLTETQKANARSNIGAGASSFSGDYNDLTNKPTIGNGVLTLQLNGTDVQTFGANDTGNKTANFAIDKSTVGLNNVPNVTTDDQTPTFTQSSARANLVSGDKISIICGKIMKWFSDLKTVAFSGSYNDLNDKPTIPTVNNATLTIQKNGTNVQTFTANQGTNATANITVPTKVSQLTNDSGYTSNTGTVTQVKVGNTAYNPSSGVVGLPAYPSVGNGTLTIQRNGTNVATFTANQSGNVTANISVPAQTNTQWYLFQNKVQSTAVNFPNGWRYANVVLRDSATGRAHIFHIVKDTIVETSTFVGGYFYNTADCGSFAITVSTTGITAKSVTIAGSVRAATATTLTISISA